MGRYSARGLQAFQWRFDQIWDKALSGYNLSIFGVYKGY